VPHQAIQQDVFSPWSIAHPFFADATAAKRNMSLVFKATLALPGNPNISDR
jgi:hypothetical protein